MKLDPLAEFARLRQELLEEKANCEARLAEINRVLGGESATRIPVQAQEAPAKTMPRGPQQRRRGPRGQNQMSLREAVFEALSTRGPLSRKELVDAVQDLGYVFQTKNPLNSMGVILYAKNSPVVRKNGKIYLRSGVKPPSAVPGSPLGAAPRKKKRVMSEEAKRKIAAAQAARWARIRAEQAKGGR